jgi:hypothetical protein
MLPLAVGTGLINNFNLLMVLILVVLACLLHKHLLLLSIAMVPCMVILHLLMVTPMVTLLHTMFGCVHNLLLGLLLVLL